MKAQLRTNERAPSMSLLPRKYGWGWSFLFLLNEMCAEIAPPPLPPSFPFGQAGEPTSLRLANERGGDWAPRRPVPRSPASPVPRSQSGDALWWCAGCRKSPAAREGASERVRASKEGNATRRGFPDWARGRERKCRAGGKRTSRGSAPGTFQPGQGRLRWAELLQEQQWSVVLAAAVLSPRSCPQAQSK